MTKDEIKAAVERFIKRVEKALKDEDAAEDIIEAVYKLLKDLDIPVGADDSLKETPDEQVKTSS